MHVAVQISSLTMCLPADFRLTLVFTAPACQAMLMVADSFFPARRSIVFNFADVRRNWRLLDTATEGLCLSQITVSVNRTRIGHFLHEAQRAARGLPSGWRK